MSVLPSLCLAVLQLSATSATFLSDVSSLSELPLQKLLLVKNNLDAEKKLTEEEVFQDEPEPEIQAQALQAKIDHIFPKKSGKKGFAMIFHMSVTVLAFLAFGGYLLCLLVQAIRQKQVYAADPLIYASPIRRKPVLRGRRSANADLGTDQLYYALRMFSEGYATYTADYAQYNRSVFF